eukprot:CAMPEP_0198206626 /NCGR_PEP_ID=MMETSP1445-20131203/10180_1 /TAXON_ID=36898 /ORGANISM="Pyramimonas sp., Strain CCMP2087" /LENGTH=363 /DNA_ID=CAMNT_0043879399 /DNA_START=66 /DNA_END=1154 /DNA_ORIENTATION=-
MSGLTSAAKRGDVDVVKRLCGLPGFDVNQQDCLGNTALHQAARFGHEEVVHLLLSCTGVASGVKNHEGLTPYELAEQSNHVTVLERLSQATGRQTAYETLKAEKDSMRFSLRTVIQESDAEVARVQQENDKLREENDNLIRNIKLVNLDQAQKELRELQASSRVLQESLDNEIHQKGVLQDMIDKVGGMCEQLQDDKQIIENEFEEYKTGKTEQLRSLTEEKEQLQVELTSAGDRLTSLTEKHQATEIKLREREREIEGKAVEAEELQLKVESAVEKLTDDKQRIEKEFEEHKVEMKDMPEQLRSLSEEKERLQVELTSLAEKHQATENKLKETLLKSEQDIEGKHLKKEESQGGGATHTSFW